MPDRTSLRTRVTPASVHAESWRTRLLAAPRQSPLEACGLGPGDDVLVAVAHPDDETLAMGATLAAFAAGGVEVRVLVMSRGEAALDHVGVPCPDLPDRRGAELAAAVTELGATAVASPGLPDGALVDHHREMVAVVSDELARRRPGRLLTVWRDDPHPDHRAVALAGLEAAAATGVEVDELGLWATHWTDPDTVGADLVLLACDDPSRAARDRALDRYASQREPLYPDLEAVLPASVLAWPHEYLVRP